MRFVLLLAALSGSLLPFHAAAQEFPSKPVKVVLVAVPGSAPDSVARILSLEMPKTLGQPLVIENMPGAGGLIAYEHVARRVAADGYTTMLVSTSNLSILPLITKELRFDPLSDLPPVIGLAEGLSLLATSSQLPWRTLGELIANAKVNPGKLNYGTSSPALRFPTLLLMQEAGLDLVHIPYSSGARFTQALAAAEVQLGFVSEAAALALGDRVRILGVTGAQRNPRLPGVPTFAELGHPRMPGLGYSLNVPARTAQPVIDRLHAAASRALKQPDVKARLEKIGLDVVDQPGDVVARKMVEEAKLFAGIARRAGIQPQ